MQCNQIKQTPEGNKDILEILNLGVNNCVPIPCFDIE